MIRSLQYFALGVPKLEPGCDFYSTFGLETIDRPDHVAFRCHDRAQDQIVLVETGRDRKLHHLSFGTDGAGLAKIAANLQRHGIDRLDPPYGGAPDGLWFHDGDGNLINIQIADAQPIPAEPLRASNGPGRVGRLGQRGCPERNHPVRPRRLGHLIIFARDVPAQARFYCDVLGMRVSDTIQGGYAAFLRTAGTSDHHVLGLISSATPGFHHASFEMGSIDEAELGAMRLFHKGYRHAWGPGRHGVGSNYFHYFRDPWNGLAEYFFDIDVIPDDFPWEAKDWTKKDGMFLWSADGMPPSDFSQNYEAE